jgi:hypothetical protein
MNLVLIHTGLSRASIIFSLIIGLYGLWRFLRKEGVNANFWGILAAGELLYVVQGLIGMWLYLSGLGASLPRPGIHILYGAVLVISVPGAFAYTRGRDQHREALIYGLVGLFLAGVSLRAILTA